MKINFHTAKKSNWGDLQVQISKELCNRLKMGKDFVVEFKSNKTPKQLRGYWRLVGLIEPYCKEAFGGIFDKEMTSEMVKIRSDFVEKVKIGREKVVLTKSLKNATKEDLMILIEKLYQICAFFELEGYELTPEELRDIN